MLLIDIADSSLEYDTHDKLSLYAEFGIQQYWVFDLMHRELWGCSEPCSRENRWYYENVKKYGPTDRVPMTLDSLAKQITVERQNVIL